MHTDRRRFLHATAAGVGVASASGWLKALADSPAAVKPAKSCILLWMDGGMSHKDTLDLKPDSKGAGEFKAIKTSTPGLEVSEHLPKLAERMHLGAVVRSMSTSEGAHARAKHHLHTGYREGQGGLHYPSLGATASAEIGKASASVPNFVSIGGRSFGSGYLGPKHQPLIVTDPTRGVEDLKAAVSDGQFTARLDLLSQMEKAFHHDYQADVTTDHSTAYQRAVSLMRSKEAKAFDLSLEPAAAKSKYGSGKFADGVLMARRLVEVGVPFVEVVLGGWDTHMDNFGRVKALSGQVDAAVSALLDDLKSRGLLKSTLVVWMGEFGRTPGINTRGAKPGRDHYPKAWSLAMWGGGLRGGTVVGKTDKEGAEVDGPKVGVSDLLGTVCELIGVDHTKKIDTPVGRPIQIVDKAKPFTGLVV